MTPTITPKKSAHTSLSARSGRPQNIAQRADQALVNVQNDDNRAAAEPLNDVSAPIGIPLIKIRDSVFNYAFSPFGAIIISQSHAFKNSFVRPIRRSLMRKLSSKPFQVFVSVCPSIERKQDDDHKGPERVHDEVDHHFRPCGGI